MAFHMLELEARPYPPQQKKIHPDRISNVCKKRFLHLIEWERAQIDFSLGLGSEDCHESKALAEG